VEYSLTPSGSEVVEHLLPLVIWAVDRGPEILARWEEPTGESGSPR